MFRLDFDTFDPASNPCEVQEISVIHPSLNDVMPGTAGVQILRIAVNTSGAVNPLSVTDINFSAKGATTAQVTSANLYYTGLDDAFSTSNLVGTLAAPAANAFNFTLTTATPIPHGIHYF